MTWRLGNLVIRGELFNLKRNHVHGWLELLGAETVIHLGLTGNMEGELAGKRVFFETALAEEEGARGQEPGASDPSSSGPDLQALELHQIGPTGTMTLERGVPPDQVKLTLEWFSQNGRVLIELDNPRLDVTADSGDDDEPAMPDPVAAAAGPDTESPYRPDLDDDPDELPDDADEDDPYGLFPPGLEEHLEEETTTSEIAAIDDAALVDDDLPDFLREDRPKRTWDEVIPGIDEQTKRLYESWDEIFEGKKDVPLSTIFDPPLNIYPVDKLSDAEVEAAFKVILRRLAMHSVALDMCEHFSFRDAYRLLVEEILPKYPVYPGLPLTGYVQHYSTWEFCRKCDEEFERKWQAEQKEREEREARGESANDPLPPDDEIPF